MEPGFNFGLLVVIFLISGFKQGLTGFGFGIIAMALLPLVMEVREATATVTLIGTVSILGSLGIFWKKVSWQECRPLLLGIGIGIPLGVFLLNAVSPLIVTRTLGVVLVSISILQAFLPKDQKLIFPKFLGFPLGLLSGLLGGAFNMGGPPVLVYLQSRPLKVNVLIATLQVLSAATMFVRSCLIAGSGLINSHILIAVAVGILPTWFGIIISARLQNFVPQKVLGHIVLAALFLLGIIYIVL